MQVAGPLTTREEERITFELRLYRALQTAYSATRDRVMQTVEDEGDLPDLFWKRERRVYAALLAPLLADGLRFGVRLACDGVNARKLKIQAALLRTARRQTDSLSEFIIARLARWTRKILDAWMAKRAPLADLERRLWVGPFNETYLETLVITETTRLISAGQVLGWRALRHRPAPGSPVVVAVRWRARCDDTCATCRPLDGRTVPLGVAFGRDLYHPPAHPRCRCELEPVVHGESPDLKTEAAP